ncbi:MAG TPA: potassium-transporting ATPase subunit KdpA, partial [Aggregatilineales bacterium]|nr:potassium-transporting ATPase subunit KdpA [Aggregatilineales bacterium]
MTELELLQIALFLGTLVISTPLLGRYMARVFAGERTLLTPLLRPLESWTYRLAGIDATTEQTWRGYA